MCKEWFDDNSLVKQITNKITILYANNWRDDNSLALPNYYSCY